jgi:type VI secretion system secreted protein Hcp
MAQNLYLELTIDGERVVGGVLAPPPGREDDIECLGYSHGVALSIAPGSTTTQSTGRRKHDRLVMRKTIDHTSPKLFQALVENKSVTAVVRFYRAAADGSQEWYYTVEIREARIASVVQNAFDTFRPETKDLPEVETVSFVFDSIKWREETKGVESEDAIRGET